MYSTSTFGSSYEVELLDGMIGNRNLSALIFQAVKISTFSLDMLKTLDPASEDMFQDGASEPSHVDVNDKSAGIDASFVSVINKQIGKVV